LVLRLDEVGFVWEVAAHCLNRHRGGAELVLEEVADCPLAWDAEGGVEVARTVEVGLRVLLVL
jgi:hypothetical protein